MPQNENDNSGVKIPPPVIFIVGLIIGFGLDYQWPAPQLPTDVQFISGGFLILISFVPAIWGLKLFIKAKTNLDVRKPTHQIVTTGPYQWSRNPIYLSLCILYIGIAVAADSIWVLLFLVPAVFVIHHRVILREEAYLERKFGEEYINYKNSVRRWI